MDTGLGNPLIENYKREREKLEEQHKKDLKYSNTAQVFLTAICLLLIYMINKWLDKAGMDDIVAFLITLPLSVPILGAGWLFGKKLTRQRKRTPKEYDFEGTWDMVCKFHAPLLNADSQFVVKNEKILMDSFKGRIEVGETEWAQDEYGITISCDRAFAAKIAADGEDVGADPEDVLDIEGKRYVADKNNRTVVMFQSDLASFDATQIRWVFTARVEWPDVVELNHNFKGVEEYRIERGPDGRPEALYGELLGCIDIDGWQYILSAESRFIKRKEGSKAATN